MSSGDEADQDPGFHLAVGIGVGVVGLIAAVICGVIALTGPEIRLGVFVGFLFGYAFACVGVTVVGQALVDRRLVSAVICGAAALLLAALILARRDDFDPAGLLVGAMAVASIGWWGWVAYRGHRTHGR